MRQVSVTIGELRIMIATKKYNTAINLFLRDSTFKKIEVKP